MNRRNVTITPGKLLAGAAWVCTFVMLVALFFDWVVVDVKRAVILVFCVLVAIVASAWESRDVNR